MRTLIGLLLVAALAGGGFYYAKYVRADRAPNYRTAEVEQGELLITISATGTLEPEEVVDVGAQVMGRIKELGIDPRGEVDSKFKGKHVDYNSVVKEGDLLAQIDPALFKATYDQAQAAVNLAKADLQQAEAKVNQTKAEFNRATRLREVKLGSVSGLGQREGQPPTPSTIKGISDADFIMAEANYRVAVATEAIARAALEQAEAVLFSAKTNLDYTTIRSPVDGTIIDRRVNIGQTVVASLNAPSLFLIAMDLKRMEIWTAVNEADIGQLKVGMPVSFTVDAFPGETFRGEVAEIRLNAEMQNHVVVYRVIVSTDNADLRLLPYLSAHVQFEVDRRENSLLVPNAALRYTPRPELVVAAPAPAATSLTATAEAPEVHTADQANQAGQEPETKGEPRRVWVRQGAKVYAVDVLVGVTDGSRSEILEGDLKPGMELVLGEEIAEAPAEGTNPLAPPRIKGKKRI
jgi:HlyD family secretion protein